MTNRERVLAVLNGKRPDDRLPMVEWASYWDKTLRRWEGEGLPKSQSQQEVTDFFGLDPLMQHWVSPIASNCPRPHATGVELIENEADYEKLLPMLYPQAALQALEQQLQGWKKAHDKGDIAIWFTLEGFFWFPRTLLGIEPHLYAFYDQPELLHRINQDQANFCLRAVETIGKVLTPEFMSFAEDMSYNHGPMLSKALFDEFLAPYYRQVIPAIQEMGTKVLIDTDGNVEPLIDWFQDCSIAGVLPLERQAGVDVARIHRNHPDWIMVGAYDKTVMHLGEAAMRQEFERLLPAMQAGRYIPSVDHQTPPDVSMENYRVYVKLLAEYAKKAVKV